MTDTISTISNVITACGVIVTAVGVLLAAWQLLLTHRQCVTNFEDSLAREYRELAATLPTKALLGEELTEQEFQNHFDEFYRYFDLSNQQAFLHQCGRVKPSTWQFWQDGIISNLRRPAFRRAWSEVCSRANSDFAELRALFPPDAHQKIADDQGHKRPQESLEFRRSCKQHARRTTHYTTSLKETSVS